jgi:hypothetical protein
VYRGMRWGPKLASGTIGSKKGNNSKMGIICLLGYNAMWSVESQPALWRNMPPPSLESKSKSSKKPAACFALVPCLVYSWTIKMEVTCSSEMLVDLQRTIRHYVPEDRTLSFSCFPLRE